MFIRRLKPNKLLTTAAVVLFSILGAVLVSLYWHRNQFAKELRNDVTAASDGMELCNFRSDEAHDCAVLGGSPKDAALIKALSSADAGLEPGKVPIVNERILRIRAHGVPIGQYARCYRLVELAGFTEVYVTEVEMDRGCVRIEKYMTGSARISLVQYNSPRTRTDQEIVVRRA